VPEKNDARNRPHALIDWEAAERLLHGLSQRLGRELQIAHGDEKGTGIAPFIGVFASAREEDKAPRLHREFGPTATAIGERIAKAGLSMLSGGCPGIVETAQDRFVATRINPRLQHSVGVRILALEIPEPANPHLDMEPHALNFGARLELMHRFCSGCVVLPGGLGSLLEIAYFLQYSQVARGGRGMPICLLPGSFWNPLKDMLARMGAYGTVSPNNGDLSLLHFVDSVDEAMNILLAHNGNAELARAVLAAAR